LNLALPKKPFLNGLKQSRVRMICSFGHAVVSRPKSKAFEKCASNTRVWRIRISAFFK